MTSVIRGNDNLDSADIPALTPARDSIGSYAFLYIPSGGFTDSQADRAGNTMVFYNPGGNGSANSYASGTWRCMGKVYGNGAAMARSTVWLRIS